MIKHATATVADGRTHFFVRGSEPGGQYDVILAVGFLSLPMFKNDFPYIKDNLKSDGYFIWSLASRNSIHAQLKLKGQTYLKDYFSYREYEDFIKEHFIIIDSQAYGFFVPKLWSLPWRIALPLQRFIDFILRPICPNLFHEKIYLLKNRP